jgi:hypothetical protein
MVRIISAIGFTSLGSLIVGLSQAGSCIFFDEEFSSQDMIPKAIQIKRIPILYIIAFIEE